MEVSVTKCAKPKPKFEPFTLEIKVETYQECLSLWRLFGWDRSIPEKAKELDSSINMLVIKALFINGRDALHKEMSAQGL